MHFKRFLPFAVSAASLLLIEGFLYRADFLYAGIMIADISIVLAVWRMAEGSIIDKQWWNYAILPVLFYDSLVSFSVLMPYKNDILTMQGIFLVGSLFLYFYLRSVYYHLVVPTAGRQSNFDNISSFGNFVSLYFLASALYGLQSFLSLKVWYLLPALFLAIFLLIYQTFWTAKKDIRGNILLLSVCSLAISEIGWAMFYLPFSFYVTGAILSIDYYMLVGIVKSYLSKGLDRRVLKLYLGTGLTAIFIILVTSRWL